MTGHAARIAARSRTSFQPTARSATIARNGMAATSHPLASLAAIDILRAGGNAVDAAIAASAVLAVVEPHMTGLGGDCFAIVSTPDGKLSGVNGSGRAPQALTADLVRATGATAIGGDSAHAVTVPGAVKAWEQMSLSHGRKPFGEVLQPAIAYARDGYAVAPRVGSDWADCAARLTNNKGAAKHYLKDGRAPRIGEVMAHPALAATLARIADEGASAFYTGTVAEEIVETLAALGGVMAMDDLAKVDTLAVEPVLSDYRGLTVAELPPNGQGVVALIMLNILETFDHAGLDPLGAERFHLQMEAGRLAYSVRDQFVADPASLPVSVDAVLDKAYGRSLAALIDPERRMPVAETRLPPHSDTVYLTVVDEDRMAVSFINSLYAGFGSGIVTEQAGVTLQNRGSCFSLEAGHPNELAPGKRPLHTIIPAFALEAGQPLMPFGVMGGAYQAVGHGHLISNLVDFDYGVQEALAAPRCFWEAIDGALTAETSLPATTVEGLRARGHEVNPAEVGIGGGQAILIDRENGMLVGGTEPRKDGCALGY